MLVREQEPNLSVMCLVLGTTVTGEISYRGGDQVQKILYYFGRELPPEALSAVPGHVKTSPIISKITGKPEWVVEAWVPDYY